jgi:hypothetical protein
MLNSSFTHTFQVAPNTHRVCTARSCIVNKARKTTVTFTTLDPAKLPVPSCAYLELHQLQKDRQLDVDRILRISRWHFCRGALTHADSLHAEFLEMARNKSKYRFYLQLTFDGNYNLTSTLSETVASRSSTTSTTILHTRILLCIHN